MENKILGVEDEMSKYEWHKSNDGCRPDNFDMVMYSTWYDGFHYDTGVYLQETDEIMVFDNALEKDCTRLHFDNFEYWRVFLEPDEKKTNRERLLKFDVYQVCKTLHILSNHGYLYEDGSSMSDYIKLVKDNWKAYETKGKDEVKDTKENLIKRFEILKTMYDNSDIHIPFNEYAAEQWDKVDMKHFETIG